MLCDVMSDQGHCCLLRYVCQNRLNTVVTCIPCTDDDNPNKLRASAAFPLLKQCLKQMYLQEEKQETCL